MELPHDVEVDCNRDRLPVQEIYAFLKTTYWAGNRSFETVEKSIDHSLCFGMYFQNKLIGFARVITDTCIFAYLCDVFILPEYQGKGYGKLLMDKVHHHPDLINMRRWFLATKDAHGLYRQFGYNELQNPARWMELFRADL